MDANAPRAEKWRQRWRIGSACLASVVAAAGGWAWWVERAPTASPAGPGERVACPLPAPTGPHPGMVWVPPGEFAPGDSVYPEERPRPRLRVSGFWMDRHEVTNDEFAAFVRATGHVTTAERAPAPGAVVFAKPDSVRGRDDVSQWWRFAPGAHWRQPGGPGTSLAGRGALPVVAVTVDDARAYARWKGRALPTEAQWEWAARAARDEPPAGVTSPPAQANTWQGLFPVVNTAEDGFAGLAPVGCYAANALGLYDMIGNAWELTADAWDASAPAPPGTAPAVVIKGGSYLCARNYCMRYRAGARQPQERDLAAGHVGFRTILVADGP